MARRETQIGKKRRDLYASHGQYLSGSTLELNPSGVTIDKGGIDLGQGTNYAFYRGLSALTSISNGTLDISTGLSTVNSFMCTVEVSDSGNATPAFCTVKSNSAGTVNVACYVNRATGCVTLPAKVSGTSLHWLAMGTK